ncbi:gamma-glutamylcyclotransferase family protein [Clostridium minihomine]|uniref:gamma-glutamylcyclotransferase family protein n=1 Tax=Clostridium minihomine TaxID=2045012 RepID=UPI0013ED5945|nr:gamma-glutamylcyclotransferase family protein [Clostridium minihomine]
MKKKIYIAYGSNMNKKQMQNRCPDAEMVGVAELPNYQLQFRRVLTVVPCPGSSVPVTVWRISTKDEANLDVYEGYPSFYRKEQLFIPFSDGSAHSGMIYLMNGGFIAPPSVHYFNIVEQGYRDFDLNISPLTEALQSSLLEKKSSLQCGFQYGV